MAATDDTGTRSGPAGVRTGGIGVQQWLTLTITLVATTLIVIDNTVLNVAIPTIMREFDTTLSSLQWVITGYALTFATFLMIGGRLGDVYGHRNVFIVGAALFGIGSFIASISWNVVSLVIGEAVIKGLGASLMLPTALAIISTTFQGESRAKAFAAWGAVIGAAAGLGPVLGGWLTTDHSWRWAFRINVLIVPLAILGAMLFIKDDGEHRKREPLDLPGAALVAVGMFLLVFSLSEGGVYGWLAPIRDFTLLGIDVWPADRPFSLVPLVFVVAVGVLVAFYRYEQHRERTERRPLFEFRLFRVRTFRYGLLASAFIAMAQLGTLLTLALFLQDAVRLDALENGLWTLPIGLAILVGATVGGRLVQPLGIPGVVRVGLVIQLIGLGYLALQMRPDITFLVLLPGLVGYGLGNGMATSQITNVVLSEIPVDKSGVASGTNSTIRQVGSALGIALIGTLVTTLTVRDAVDRLGASSPLPDEVRRTAAERVRDLGTGYRPSGGGPVVQQLDRIATESVTAGTQAAMLFAVGVVGVGAVLTFLIPTTVRSVVPPEAELAEDLASLAPIGAGAELAATACEGSTPPARPGSPD